MANEVGINVLRSSKGARVRAGDVVGVLYSGSLLDGDGAPFDANYDFATFSAIPARQLFTFELGGAQVIQGWDQALAGRRLGEVLDLTIPSELAYGSAGAPPSIPPNAPLRFRVELVGSIPAGESEAIYPSYSDLGLSKKLFNQLKAAKPKVADRKIGTDASDLLTGGASEDLLIGLGGEDVLQGNGQPDVLIGGPGGSRYVYTDLKIPLPAPAARTAFWDSSLPVIRLIFRYSAILWFTSASVHLVRQLEKCGLPKALCCWITTVMGGRSWRSF